MKRIALILATLATLATALASPAEARGWRGGGWGWGPGIGLGIAAGALAAGAYGAYGPYGLWLRTPISRVLRAALCVLRTRLLSAALLLRMVT